MGSIAKHDLEVQQLCRQRSIQGADVCNSVKYSVDVSDAEDDRIIIVVMLLLTVVYLLIEAFGFITIGGASVAAFVKVYGVAAMVLFSVTTIHFVIFAFTTKTTAVTDL